LKIKGDDGSWMILDESRQINTSKGTLLFPVEERQMNNNITFESD
jgi:hypothetical protein